MLHYDFMRTAFAAATIVAIVAGPIGYFLVLRGQTFAGHALAHVGFTGATGAILIGFSPLAGLVCLTVAAGIAMGFLGERLRSRSASDFCSCTSSRPSPPRRQPCCSGTC